MRTLTLSALLLLAAGTVSLAAPAPFHRPERPGRGDDLARLQGTWETTYGATWDFDRWQSLPAEGGFTLKGTHLSWHKLGWTERIHLFAGSPKRVDYVRDGTTSQAIYQLTGDTLTVVIAAVGSPRPTSLDIGRDDTLRLIYRRVK